MAFLPENDEAAERLTEGEREIKLAELRAAILEDDNEVLNRLLAEVDLTGWKVLIEPVESLLEKVHKSGSAEALFQIGMENTDSLTTLLNERALVFAGDRGAELVGMRNIGSAEFPEWIENPSAKWAITDTTRTMIRNDVATAINEGWSSRHLAKELAENNPAFSDYRAEMIARTEIRKADVAGNMAAYQASGIVQGKEWIIGSRHGHIDGCDANHQQGPIPFNQPFATGDQAVPSHPNCVCDILPVLMPKVQGTTEAAPGGAPTE
ncbi:hypothetical protein CCP3SC15_1070002 [Gammaproteobacteria bacterium]